MNKSVKTHEEFIEVVRNDRKAQRVRIDRRPTIEVCFGSDGNGRLEKARTSVERVERFLQDGSTMLAQTPSGDTWKFRPHKNPRVADYFALPI